MILYLLLIGLGFCQLTLENCTDGTDGFLPSALSSVDSSIEGDFVEITLNYPGYMTAENITINELDDPVYLFEDWTLNEASSCEKENSASISIPASELADDIEGYVIEFSVTFTASYLSKDRITDLVSADEVTKTIPFEITVPESHTVIVRIELHPDSSYIPDVTSQELDELRTLTVNFTTFVHEAYRFTGVYVMTSDYFDADGATLSISSEEDNYDHPVEGEGIMQYWSLVVPDVYCDPIGTHVETLLLTLETSKIDPNSGEVMTEPMTISVELADGNCDVAGGSIIALADFYFEDRDYFLNEVINLELNFDIATPPQTSEMTGISVEQNGGIVCVNCETTMPDIQAQCHNCNSNFVANGPFYNVSFKLHENVFSAPATGATPTNINLNFGFGYNARLRVRRLLAAADQPEFGHVPLELSIRGYDCTDHDWDGVLGERLLVPCNSAKEAPAEFLCTKDRDWQLVSDCESGIPGYDDETDDDAVSEGTSSSDDSIVDTLLGYVGLTWQFIAVIAVISFCCIFCICSRMRSQKQKVTYQGQMMDETVEMANVAPADSYPEGYGAVAGRDPLDGTTIANQIISETAVTMGGDDLVTYGPGATPGYTNQFNTRSDSVLEPWASKSLTAEASATDVLGGELYGFEGTQTGGQTGGMAIPEEGPAETGGYSIVGAFDNEPTKKRAPTTSPNSKRGPRLSTGYGQVQALQDYVSNSKRTPGGFSDDEVEDVGSLYPVTSDSSKRTPASAKYIAVESEGDMTTAKREPASKSAIVVEGDETLQNLPFGGDEASPAPEAAPMQISSDFGGHVDIITPTVGGGEGGTLADPTAAEPSISAEAHGGQAMEPSVSYNGGVGGGAAEDAGGDDDTDHEDGALYTV